MASAKGKKTQGKASFRGLSPRQTIAIMHLLGGSSISKSADAAGVGPPQVYRWMREHEAFKRELEEHQRLAMEAATAQLHGAAGEAVDALLDVLRDAESGKQTVVSAAKAILDAGYRGFELSKRPEPAEASIGELLRLSRMLDAHAEKKDG